MHHFPKNHFQKIDRSFEQHRFGGFVGGCAVEVEYARRHGRLALLSRIVAGGREERGRASLACAFFPLEGLVLLFGRGKRLVPSQQLCERFERLRCSRVLLFHIVGATAAAAAAATIIIIIVIVIVIAVVIIVIVVVAATTGVADVWVVVFR